jgi:hypothetical protein
MVRLALLSALSDRADIGQIVVVDDWKLSSPKTKDAATLVRKLKLHGSVLVVLGQNELDVERSFANLPLVQTTTFGELSAHDIIRSDWLVFSDATLPTAPTDFSGTHIVEEAPDPPAEKPVKAAKATKPVKAAKATKVAKTTKAAVKAEAVAEPEPEPEAEPQATTDTASAASDEEADTDA